MLSVETGKVVAIYHPNVVARRVARPGSAIKPFVLLALLRSGKVTPNDELVCRRRVRVGGHDLDCRHVKTVEPMNAERALAYSCNAYFTDRGGRLTDDELTTAFREAGFGGATHLVADEATGAVTTVTSHDSIQLKAVGEEGIAVTPLQMAVAYRKLAQAPADPAMDTVRAGMRGAVEYGTAQAAADRNREVWGKTGTSTAAEGSWTHAWFAGFTRDVVIVVFLERGHGSNAAAIAGRILSMQRPR